MGYAELEAFHENDQNEAGWVSIGELYEELNNLEPKTWEFDLELEPLAEPTDLDPWLEPLADVGVEGEMGCAELEAFHEADQAEDDWFVLTPEDLFIAKKLLLNRQPMQQLPSFLPKMLN